MFLCKGSKYFQLLWPCSLCSLHHNYSMWESNLRWHINKRCDWVPISPFKCHVYASGNILLLSIQFRPPMDIFNPLLIYYKSSPLILFSIQFWLRRRFNISILNPLKVLSVFFALFEFLCLYTTVMGGWGGQETHPSPHNFCPIKGLLKWADCSSPLAPGYC